MEDLVIYLSYKLSIKARYEEIHDIIKANEPWASNKMI